MNKASDPILELLDELDVAVPMGVLVNELDSSKATITRALPDLLERGYIQKDDDYDSYYRITEKGRGYLAGEVDASEDDDAS